MHPNRESADNSLHRFQKEQTWPAAGPESKVEVLMTCSKQGSDFGLVFEGLIWKTYMVKLRSAQI